MQPLTEVLKDLDHVNKMVQVSMDRPNVSWALLDNLSIHWKEENAYAPNLISEAVAFKFYMAFLAQHQTRQIGTWKTLRAVLHIEQIT